MTTAIDLSFSRPAPAAIKAAGPSGVMRYIAHRTDKCLTAIEAAGYLGHGLWIGLIFEDSTTNSLQGASQGLADVAFADAAADHVGAPHSAAMFYTCDTMVTVDQVRPYFAAIRTRSVRPVGFYGGMNVGLQLQSEGLVDHVWVTNAASFSGFRHWPDLAPVARASAAVMLQTLAHPLVGIPPGAYDLNEVLRPFPAWGNSVATPKPKPTPPVQGPTVDEGDDSMYTPINGIHLDENGDGEVAVKGVKEADVRALYISGGSDANKVHRYDKTPVARGVHGSNPALIVIEGGEPGGTYSLGVTHI